MRVADKMNYEQVKSNLSRNRGELADLQNKAATQKRINKPSDDPLSAPRVLQARTEIAAGQQFMKSVNQARSFLEYSEQSLRELTEVLNRAKELALGQANDASANPTSRATTAYEVEQLYNQTVQIGNRKLGERFLFGGFKTTRPPFDKDGKYSGDDGEIKIAIQKEGTVVMNMPGNRIFLGREAKAPAGAGPDPAQAVSSPEEVRGPASLPGTALPGQGAPAAPDAELDRTGLDSSWEKSGVDVFQVLRNLSTGLRAGDKEGVQESLDELDSALAQVLLCRTQIGSRGTALNTAVDSLQKAQVDTKTLQSNLEDIDTFELVSDLNKSESTLKASLASAGKLIQPSLLDFLR
jgi:flagellar hook-associated protein 3 FlgL